MKYKDILKMKDTYNPNAQFPCIELLLKGLAKISFINKTAFEYGLYAHFSNYLKYICLKLYYRKLQEMNDDDIILTIYESFAVLLKKLGIATAIDFQSKQITINEKLILSDADIQLLLTGKEQLIKNHYIKKIHLSYCYIMNCFDKEEKFKTPLALYFFKLIIYTKQLEHISFKEKIKPEFPEVFYTDLGQLAFELFNKPNYLDTVVDKKTNLFLDIGCGNGNILDTILEINKKVKVYGIERQTVVATKLINKYKGYSNIEIINNDIQNITFNHKFDMINMSYMLFYLNLDEQKILFEAISKLLSSDGNLVICQYFPNIENFQMRMAISEKSWNRIDRFKFKIINDILHSEVLLNDSLVDFNHAIRFDEFESMITLSGFYIKEIHKADNNFYSFYITLSKNT